MSCEGKVYVGQIGVLLEVETQGVGCPVVDWADATLTEIIVRKPDGTVVEFPASVVGSKLLYLTTTALDLDLVGTYRLQAHVVGPAYDALGETVTFKISEVFK